MTDKCPTCGSPVTIEGNTTQYYVSENVALQERVEAYEAALEYYSKTESTYWDNSVCPPRLRPTFGYSGYRAEQVLAKYREGE